MLHSINNKLNPNPSERRGQVQAVPINLREFLSSEQRRALRHMEGFGWRLAFIRREMFHETMVVICNAEETAFSSIEVDGFINAEPATEFRR